MHDGEGIQIIYAGGTGILGIVGIINEELCRNNISNNKKSLRDGRLH